MGQSKEVRQRSTDDAPPDPPAKRVKVEDTKLSSSPNTPTTEDQDAKLDVKPTVRELPEAAASAAATASADFSYMQVKELQIKDTLCPAEPMSAVNNYVNKVLAVEKRIAHSKQKASKSLVAKFTTKYKWKNCENRNQKRFAENTSEGHVTCRDCGVAQDHKIHGTSMVVLVLTSTRFLRLSSVQFTVRLKWTMRAFVAGASEVALNLLVACRRIWAVLPARLNETSKHESKRL
jgi:hypothetical protein